MPGILRFAQDDKRITITLSQLSALNQQLPLAYFFSETVSMASFSPSVSSFGVRPTILR